MSLIDVGVSIRNKLNLDTFLSANIVLIENQISPIANRMKTIQGMIAQFFIMHDIENVEFISASNKLKKYMNKKETSYSDRKKMSIQITRDKITNEEWVKHFDNHVKKDDLADSFLQGLWYIEQKL